MSTSDSTAATVVDLPPAKASAASSASTAAPPSATPSTKRSMSGNSTGSTSRNNSSSSGMDDPSEAASPSSKSSFIADQQEGVLNDVLLELDRERAKRAELEAKVRFLEDDLHAHKKANSAAAAASTTNVGQKITTREYVALETELNGYLELLQALTKNRPAFHNTSKLTGLPIHVLRLLEVMPWDKRTQPHVFQKEELFEWQIWNANKNWQTELKYFPTFFKTLPIVMPQPGKTISESTERSSSFLSPNKKCVLTNIEITHIVNIEKGYPLPPSNTGCDWKWIGGWTIEKSMDTDSSGWSYSNSPDILSLTQQPNNATNNNDFSNRHRAPTKGERNIVKRRRKWSRLRVLVNYPHASEATRQYLKLLEEKATLSVSVEKMSTQLVETKTSLTALELEHDLFKEESSRKIRLLEQELEEKKSILDALEQGLVESATQAVAANNAAAASAAKSTPLLREQIGSLVSQWVTDATKKTNNNSTSNGSMSAAVSLDGSAREGSDDTIADSLNNDTGTSSNNNTSTSVTSTTSSTSTAKQRLVDWSKVAGGHGSILLGKLKEGQILEKFKDGKVLEKIKNQGGERLEQLSNLELFRAKQQQQQEQQQQVLDDKPGKEPLPEDPNEESVEIQFEKDDI